MKIANKAIKIAEQAHKGQFRRDGKTPYVSHPKAVADKFKTSHLKSVALLHDVIEDSELELTDLLAKGMPFSVCLSVGLLTKKDDENYLDYILKIKKNKMACKVKIEDMKHNLKTSKGNQKNKYLLSIFILESDLWKNTLM